MLWEDIPGSGLWVFMSGVAHGAELRDEEVIATMVGRGVLLDVSKLHKLQQRDKKKEVLEKG